MRDGAVNTQVRGHGADRAYTHGKMDIKKREFRHLTQGTKRINDYLNQFNDLARYAPDDVNTKAKKVEKFMEGLHPFLKMHLSIHGITQFQDLVNRAFILENEHANLSEERRKKARVDPRPVMQHPRPMMHGRERPHMPPPRPRFPTQPTFVPKCGKCGKGHATRDCMTGHHKINCTSPPANPTRPPMLQIQVHRPPAGRGQGGPMNYASRGAGRGGQLGGQPKLNYVAAEQLGEATYVVIGSEHSLEKQALPKKTKSNLGIKTQSKACMRILRDHVRGAVLMATTTQMILTWTQLVICMTWTSPLVVGMNKCLLI